MKESRTENKNQTLRIETAKTDRQTREERQMQEDKDRTQRIEQSKKQPAKAAK
jgi:hypothetical protein